MARGVWPGQRAPGRLWIRVRRSSSRRFGPDLARRPLPASRQTRSQSFTLQQLHGDKQFAGVLADLCDGLRIGM